MSERRLLFVQPSMLPFGGALCVAAWALEALCQDYVVDLLTWHPVDFSEIDRAYGTALAGRAIKAINAPAWLRRLVDLDPDPYSYQRVAFLMRAARMQPRPSDFIVSFCDEVDFGAPALQYIHYPYFENKYHRIYDRTRSVMSRAWAYHKFYNRPWRMLAGFHFEGMKRNVTLVNSEWTRARVRAAYGIAATILYPPVAGNFRNVTWEARENGFVCIGRLSGEKRYEQIIAILAALRARGHDLHLHLVGSGGDRSVGEYAEKIRRMAREHAGWIFMHETTSRRELDELIVQHRYGIHATVGEHFGIAVAEMVRGGCIVFAPNSGGPVEILGGDERLLYASNEQAVEIIGHVIEDSDAQHALGAALEARKDLFSVERFTQNLREIVAQCIPVH